MRVDPLLLCIQLQPHPLLKPSNLQVITYMSGRCKWISQTTRGQAVARAGGHDMLLQLVHTCCRCYVNFLQKIHSTCHKKQSSSGVAVGTGVHAPVELLLGSFCSLLCCLGLLPAMLLCL